MGERHRHDRQRRDEPAMRYERDTRRRPVVFSRWSDQRPISHNRMAAAS
jgi:hypothetical protein